MNTSEKIASVVAQFLAADREEDRKRIAELERDFARALVREREANERTGAAIHCVQSLENGAEWERKDVSATIDGLNKQLDELTEKCAALVVERDSLIGQLMDNGWPCRSTGTAEPVETPAVKQEEQGSWVVYDGEEQNRSQRIAGMRAAVKEDDWDWSSIDDARGFKTEAGAHACLRDMGSNWQNLRVITLAEARAIEAKR